MQSSQLKNGLYYAALGSCVLAALWFGLTQTTSHFDDAYITYRYARNLADGHGFVFNPGEAVLGTTAPLYGLVLALLARLGIDIPTASHALSVIGWGACIVLIERIGRVSGDKALGLLAAALVATCPLFLQVIGMETNLTLALALGSVYLYLNGHAQASFLVAALATWMRPDCALVALIVGVARLWQKRALPWREGLTYGATLLPWLLFAQLFYGSVFPNSLFAKAGQGRSALGGDEFSTFGWGLVQLASNLYSINKLYALVGLSGLIGFAAVIWRRPRWLVVVVWAVLYVASYIALGVIPFHWYFVPIWPAVALLAAGGIATVLRLARKTKWLLRSVVIASSVLLVLPQVDALRHSHVTRVSPYHRGYHAVADWLRANTPQDASVAMIEIGIIGYYSDRRVVDTMGLVSPDMVGHLQGWTQTLLYAIGHYWPDYLVALRGTAWDYITPLAWFNEAYVPAVKIPSAGSGSRAATIYQRRAGFPIRQFDWVSSYELSAESIRLSAVRIQTAQLQPGQMLHAQLEWYAREIIRDDVKVQIDLLSAQSGRRWTLAIEQPMRGGDPTFLWRPGELILDDYALRLPNDLGQGPYLLESRLLDVTRDEWLGFTDSLGKPVPHVTAGPLWVGPPVLPSVRISNPMPATFDRSIKLLGFDLGQATLCKGQPLSLTLYWQASQPIEDDYTVFVHILDGQGRLIAQQDNPPLQGNLPTSLWVPGITLQDDYQIALPADCQAGMYTIQIGLYKPDTGARLLPNSSAGQVTDRALQLTCIGQP